MELRAAERAAAPVVAAALRDEGVASAVVDGLLRDALERTNIGVAIRHDDVLVSVGLHDALTEGYKEAGGIRLPADGLLVEKRVGVKTGYPMYLFPNESKHPGFPHVTVEIGQVKVNVSIAEHPRVIAGDEGVVGIGAVLKAVRKHRAELEREWEASRPDDQKIENFKAKKGTKLGDGSA
ncbi:hypothetical protein [Sphingomonas sp.]|uniref:hypothetical protein n=1 Tax=Sphingomonas sp. TaxID=28214 RepID=UPI002DD67FE3|nr:hypothetical protein [Sphingomonas sp.]